MILASWKQLVLELTKTDMGFITITPDLDEKNQGL